MYGAGADKKNIHCVNAQSTEWIIYEVVENKIVIELCCELMQFEMVVHHDRHFSTVE